MEDAIGYIIVHDENGWIDMETFSSNRKLCWAKFLKDDAQMEFQKASDSGNKQHWQKCGFRCAKVSVRELIGAK